MVGREDILFKVTEDGPFQGVLVEGKLTVGAHSVVDPDVWASATVDIEEHTKEWLTRDILSILYGRLKQELIEFFAEANSIRVDYDDYLRYRDLIRSLEKLIDRIP